MADAPKQRLLRLLRRTSKDRLSRERATADESALWSAHERAMVRARDAGSAAQRIASGAARQRGAIEAVTERARGLASRTAELSAAFARVSDSFERLSLVALNAGLESARMSETEARPLSLVADEVRAQASRGTDAARELAAAITLVNEELGQLKAQANEAQTSVAEVTQDAARAAGAASDAEAALADVAERIKRATGSDPEAVRAIAEASERARALVLALGALSGKVPRALVIGALSPALESLAALLADGDSDAGHEGTR
jgi:methyl-accepting chemotaxis protein